MWSPLGPQPVGGGLLIQVNDMAALAVLHYLLEGRTTELGWKSIPQLILEVAVPKHHLLWCSYSYNVS